MGFPIFIGQDLLHGLSGLMLLGGVSCAEVTRLSAMLAEIAGRGEGPEGSVSVENPPCLAFGAVARVRVRTRW
jgi:hypothetical protein